MQSSCFILNMLCEKKKKKEIQHPWYAPLLFLLPGYSLMQKSQMLTKIKVVVHSHETSALQIA